MALDLASITSPIHNWVLFLLWLHPFILSGVISPLISSRYWAPFDLGSSSVSATFFPFYTVHGVLKARILKWFAIPFSRGPHFVRTLHHDRLSWVAPHGMAHSFIELDKAVVHGNRLVSFCDYGFHSVFPLLEKDKRLMEAS